jgi:hypothetical protein
VRVVPPLIPPLVLLSLIAAHAVNVPRWDEWDLLPFVLALRDGTVGLADFWAQHNEHRLTAVKLLLAPLVLATDFDVRAMMYTGFCLQLLAFVFLWRTLVTTLEARDQALGTALAFVIALLMFSPAQDQNWLWGLTSMQWHLCNLTGAAAVYLLARRPRPRFALAGCFLLTCAGMTAVASGIVLWGMVLVVIAMEAIAARTRPPWPVLAGWAAGALVLAFYFAGFRTTAVAPNVWSFLHHPRAFFGFVRVYLGWPLVQGDNLRLAAAFGMAGLVGLAAAAYAVLVRRFLAERLLPWLGLSTYALLVALATAVGRVQLGVVVATANRYSTGALLFWIGLLVVAALAVRQALENARGRRRRLLLAAPAAVLMVAGLNYARLYREGYRRFVESRQDRLIGLADVFAYRTASDSAMSLLYPPSAAHVREYARILDTRGLGPFARHTIGLRGQLAQVLRPATQVGAGEGRLEVAACTVIAGWAWDRRQPDVPVNVDIYDGDVHLGTVTAYWFRRDLAEAGIGRGRHLYLFQPPASIKDGRGHSIRARIAGTDADLAGAPMPFQCSDVKAVLWR